MKVLVATVGYILLVDLDTKDVAVLESERSEYYGISWWENSKSLVLSHSGLSNNLMYDLNDYIKSEKGYLSFGNAHSAQFLSQPHQIFCAPDDIVITTNTGRNCITLYNHKNGFYKDIRINDIYWDRLSVEDTCGEHFNSVFLKNDKLYVLAHRYTKISNVLVFSYPDCILLEKYVTNYVSGLHNIWVDNNQNMIACHSEMGALYEVKSKEHIWQTACENSYLRGLAVSTDYLILGDSNRTKRDNRKYVQSDLWIVDRKTLSTVDYMSLGRYGAVHEIRLVDVADEAHHNHPFSEVSILEKMIQEQERKELTRSQEKIRMSQQWKNNLGLLQTSVMNSWVKDKEWFVPKNEDFTLSLLPISPKDYQTLSLDFAFSDTSVLTNQHLGFIFGYRGPLDTNMGAIIICNETGIEASRISLWLNEKNNWHEREVLFDISQSTGKLTIVIEKNQLTIKCDNLTPVIRTFHSSELEGAIGIRAHGSKFKNLTIETISDKQLIPN